LVQGAWANTPSWSGVIARLEAEGYTVDAPPNPLRSLNGDAATIADFLHTIKGPIVLVGRSYGGAVITNAATGNHQVKALAYVDAFAPAKGGSALGLDSSKPGSALGAAPAKVFNFVPYPGAPKGDALLYVKPAVFEQAFVDGLPAREGSVLAATQAPVAYSALTAPSGTPAWKTIPELVRARHDRPSDPASHPAVHGPASPRTHHKSACRSPVDDRRSGGGRQGDHRSRASHQVTHVPVILRSV
jgi:pimeloyl-ACP methyl ester carboxylesterase